MSANTTTTSTVLSMHMFEGMQLVTGNESTLASGWFDSLAESEGLCYREEVPLLSTVLVPDMGLL